MWGEMVVRWGGGERWRRVVERGSRNRKLKLEGGGQIVTVPKMFITGLQGQRCMKGGGVEKTERMAERDLRNVRCGTRGAGKLLCNREVNVRCGGGHIYVGESQWREVWREIPIITKSLQGVVCNHPTDPHRHGAFQSSLGPSFLWPNTAD